MIPTEADPAAALPPMNTVNEWQVVASDPAAGLQVTLTPVAGEAKVVVLDQGKVRYSLPA